MTVINPFDFFVEPSAAILPWRYTDELRHDLAAYLQPEDDGPLLRAAVAELQPDGVGTLDFLVGLNAQIQKRIAYLVRLEPGVQTPDETLALGSGSCRDSAWLQIQILRRLGFAARFVSGYLIQLRADIDPVDGPQGARSDFTDLHAWTEVYIPGAGWIGLDLHLRAPVRRGPPAPGRDSPLPLLGADQRSRERGQHGLLLRDGPTASHRADPHHPAVRRRGLDGPRPGGRPGRSRPEGAGCAPDHGRRADVRLDRRFRGRRMEHGRLRPDQAEDRQAAAGPFARPVRPRLHGPLRSGQMVPRRTAAALGAGALLATGRPAGLARRLAGRGARPQAQRRRRPGLPAAPGGAPRRRSGPYPGGARRPAGHDQGGGGPSRRRGPGRRGDRRGGGARRPQPRHGRRPVEGGRPRAAPAPGFQPGRGRRLGQRSLDLPPRPPLPHARRLPHRPAPAAVGPAGTGPEGLSAHRARRPLRGNAGPCRPSTTSMHPTGAPARTHRPSRARSDMFGRPCRCSPGTGRSTCSCLRWRGWRTTWPWPPTWTRRARACRSGSKAMRRPTTSGWRC